MLKVEELVCPNCGQTNQPHANNIEIDRGMAACNGCGHRRPVSEFQQKEK